jgi:hypothetical protein
MFGRAHLSQCRGESRSRRQVAPACGVQSISTTCESSAARTACYARFIVCVRCTLHTCRDPLLARGSGAKLNRQTQSRHGLLVLLLASDSHGLGLGVALFRMRASYHTGDLGSIAFHFRKTGEGHRTSSACLSSEVMALSPTVLQTSRHGDAASPPTKATWL